MKKYYSIAICLSAVLMGICLASCDKDSDDSESSKPAASIVGTWTRDTNVGVNREFIVFYSDNVVHQVTSNTKTYEVVEVKRGTYTYDSSTGNCTIDGEAIDMKVESDKMYITTNGNIVAYTKNYPVASRNEIEQWYQELYGGGAITKDSIIGTWELEDNGKNWLQLIMFYPDNYVFVLIVNTETSTINELEKYKYNFNPSTSSLIVDGIGRKVEIKSNKLYMPVDDETYVYKKVEDKYTREEIETLYKSNK